MIILCNLIFLSERRITIKELKCFFLLFLQLQSNIFGWLNRTFIQFLTSRAGNDCLAYSLLDFRLILLNFLWESWIILRFFFFLWRFWRFFLFRFLFRLFYSVRLVFIYRIFFWLPSNQFIGCNSFTSTKMTGQNSSKFFIQFL